MSETTEPLSASDSYAFYSKQLNLLGDRDPVEVLAATPGVLAQILDRHSAQVMRQRPFPGKWTANEVLAHLADMEWVFGLRARTILCDDHPTLEPIDQDLWVEVQQPNERAPAELLAELRALRKVNVELWRRLTPDELERTGYHPGAGIDLSLNLMRRIQAGHDLNHLEQIQRHLAAVGAERGST